MEYVNGISDVATTSGTGNMTAAGTPPTARQALSLIGAVGSTFGYRIELGAQWEVGRGTVVSTGPLVFSRAPADGSSGVSTLVNFSGTGAIITHCLTAAEMLDFWRPRTLTLTAVGATPFSGGVNTDRYDRIVCTGGTANVTSFSTGLTGTPVEGQVLTIAYTGTAGRTFVFGPLFEDSTIAKPTGSTGTEKITMSFEWNSVSGKYRHMGSA